MFTIGSNVILKQENINNTLEQVLKILKDEKLLIIDDQGIVSNENELKSIINTHDEYDFKVIPIIKYEQNAMLEVKDYLEDVIVKINSIVNMENKANPTIALVEILESIEELKKVDLYFNLDSLNQFNTKSVSEHVLNEIQNQNESVTYDVLEFECLPALLNLETAINRKLVQ
jgi:desulfoferrodoxin (superoxide reductase-like protein)